MALGAFMIGVLLSTTAFAQQIKAGRVDLVVGEVNCGHRALMPGSPGLGSPLGDHVIWRGSVLRRLPLGLFLPTVPLRTHYP